MNAVDRLVPGVTTVTLNARYYPLHGLIAAEARNRDLDRPAAQGLMRRAEVAVGAVSARHLHVDPVRHRALSRPHGYDMIMPQVRAGSVDIDALAVPGVYAQPSWGFWSPYRGSEAVLQIIKANAFAPGEQFDLPAVREGLGDVLHLTDLHTLGTDTLDDHAHLCICQSVSSSDGAWLARLFAQPGISDERQTRAWTRRQTLRILTRCVELTSVQQASSRRSALSSIRRGGHGRSRSRLYGGFCALAWRDSAQSLGRRLARPVGVDCERHRWAHPTHHTGRPIRRRVATADGWDVQPWSSCHSHFRRPSRPRGTRRGSGGIRLADLGPEHSATRRAPIP